MTQQILDHMTESGIYNESDLAPFHKRLNDLRRVTLPCFISSYKADTDLTSYIVRSDAESGKHPVAMTTLLERQLNECGA